MLFSTPKTKGGLRSHFLGDSSKITPSIWETRWPAAETEEKKKREKKRFRMVGEKNKGNGGKDNNKKNQPRWHRGCIPPAPSRTSQKPGPLCISPLAHGALPKQGKGCRWKDRRRSSLPAMMLPPPWVLLAVSPAGTAAPRSPTPGGSPGCVRQHDTSQGHIWYEITPFQGIIITKKPNTLNSLWGSFTLGSLSSAGRLAASVPVGSSPPNIPFEFPIRGSRRRDGGGRF